MPASAHTLTATTAMGQIMEAVARVELLQEGGNDTNPNNATPINYDVDLDANTVSISVQAEITHTVDTSGNIVVVAVDPFEDPPSP